MAGSPPNTCRPMRRNSTPVEHLWGHRKQHELPNVCPKDSWQLSEGTRSRWFLSEIYYANLSRHRRHHSGVSRKVQIIADPPDSRLSRPIQTGQKTGQLEPDLPSLRGDPAKHGHAVRGSRNGRITIDRILRAPLFQAL